LLLSTGDGFKKFKKMCLLTHFLFFVFCRNSTSYFSIIFLNEAVSCLRFGLKKTQSPPTKKNPKEICVGLIEKSNAKYLDFDIEKMIQG